MAGKSLQWIERKASKNIQDMHWKRKKIRRERKSEKSLKCIQKIFWPDRLWQTYRQTDRWWLWYEDRTKEREENIWADDEVSSWEIGRREKKKKGSEEIVFSPPPCQIVQSCTFSPIDLVLSSLLIQVLVGVIGGSPGIKEWMNGALCGSPFETDQ